MMKRLFVLGLLPLAACGPSRWDQAAAACEQQYPPSVEREMCLGRVQADLQAFLGGLQAASTANRQLLLGPPQTPAFTCYALGGGVTHCQ